LQQTEEKLRQTENNLEQAQKALFMQELDTVIEQFEQEQRNAANAPKLEGEELVNALKGAANASDEEFEEQLLSGELLRMLNAVWVVE
jgi:hypothetical protein